MQKGQSETSDRAYGVGTHPCHYQYSALILGQSVTFLYDRHFNLGTCLQQQSSLAFCEFISHFIDGS